MVQPNEITSLNSLTDSCFDGLRSRAKERAGNEIFAKNKQDSIEAISLGFFFPSRKLFGIPERESSLILKETKNMAPYRLWATDEPMHMPGNPQPLYGSIPYVTALTNVSQSAALWINSA